MKWLDIVENTDKTDLSESLDKIADYKFVDANRAFFQIGDLNYLVVFRNVGNGKIPWPTPDGISERNNGIITVISFAQVKESGLDDGITKTGNAMMVFGTVIEIILEYVEKHKPRKVLFDSKEPSRNKLYRALIKKLAPVMEINGYTNLEPFEHSGTLNFPFELR